MKNIIYILAFASFAFCANQPNRFDGALDWYGYNALLTTELYTENHMEDEDDDVFRKRRHRRRRKIGPSKKGW